MEAARGAGCRWITNTPITLRNVVKQIRVGPKGMLLAVLNFASSQDYGKTVEPTMALAVDVLKKGQRQRRQREGGDLHSKPPSPFVHYFRSFVRSESLGHLGCRRQRERQSERILKDAVAAAAVRSVPFPCRSPQPQLAACYHLEAPPFWWCPPFCPPPSMRVELNLGLILRVEERSSLLRVSGDEVA